MINCFRLFSLLRRLGQVSNMLLLMWSLFENKWFCLTWRLKPAQDLKSLRALQWAEERFLCLPQRKHLCGCLICLKRSFERKNFYPNPGWKLRKTQMFAKYYFLLINLNTICDFTWCCFNHFNYSRFGKTFAYCLCDTQTRRRKTNSDVRKSFCFKENENSTH